MDETVAQGAAFPLRPLVFLAIREDTAAVSA
jgi:hypothetical protein